jgi:hypothetical protein
MDVGEMRGIWMAYGDHDMELLKVGWISGHIPRVDYYT